MTFVLHSFNDWLDDEALVEARRALYREVYGPRAQPAAATTKTEEPSR